MQPAKFAARFRSKYVCVCGYMEVHVPKVNEIVVVHSNFHFESIHLNGPQIVIFKLAQMTGARIYSKNALVPSMIYGKQINK